MTDKERYDLYLEMQSCIATAIEFSKGDGCMNSEIRDLIIDKLLLKAANIKEQLKNEI